MAKGTTSTPHDAVFKQFLTQADTARDFLAIHLPPALRQRCDLDTLQLESASFIEESLRAWYSDVLWSLNWLDCFADPQLASELYISPFPLVDVTVIPDDEIVRHRRVALLELIQKHIRQRDLMGIVEQLTTILLSGDANDRQLKTLFNYLLQTGNARRFGRFIHEVAQRVPQHRERLMTIAERLQEVGRRKGKREGQHAEALRIAQRMLADGIARETVVKITGLTADEIAALAH